MKAKSVRDPVHPAKSVFTAYLKDKEIKATDLQSDLLRRFYEILSTSNQRFNLVSRNQQRITSILDQIGDSLLAQNLISILNPQILLDLGSGGGFPGIPLAILNPHIQVHLLEASHKRVSHLKRTTRLLSLPNVQVIHDRVENMPERASIPPYDIVIARSVVDLPTLAGWCKPLLKTNGILVTYAGNRDAWRLERLLHGWPCTLKPLLVRSLDIGIRPEKPHRLLLIGNFG